MNPEPAQFQGRGLACFGGHLLIAVFLATSSTYASATCRDAIGTGADPLLFENSLNSEGFLETQFGPGRPTTNEISPFDLQTCRTLLRSQPNFALPTMGFLG